MSRLIEIQQGISVNVDLIDAVEEVDKFSCKVYVGTRTYLSTFSYETLMGLIKQGEVVDKGTPLSEMSEKTMKKLDAVLTNAGYYAG